MHSRLLAIPSLLSLLALIALLALPALASAAEPQVVSGTGTGSDPALAVSTNGTSVVAWEDFNTIACTGLRYATRKSDGTLTAPQPFPGAGPCSRHADLSALSDGRVLAVWDAGSSADNAIQFSLIGTDGVAAPAQTIGTGNDIATPKVVTDDHDRSIVVYQGPRVGGPAGNGSYRARAVLVKPDGGFSEEIDVSKRDAYFPDVATDGRGRATVAWATGDFYGRPVNQVQARTVLPGGAMGPLRTLSAKGERGRQASVSIAGNRASVVWTSGNDVRAAQLIPSGKATKAVTLSNSSKLVPSAPVALGDGGTYVSWATRKGSAFRVVASGLSSRGKPLGVRTVAEDARGPVLSSLGHDIADLGYIGVTAGSSFATLTRAGGRVEATTPLFGSDAIVKGLQLAPLPDGSRIAAGVVSSGDVVGAIELVVASG